MEQQPVKRHSSFEEILNDKPKNMSMLDRALEGASVEQKARVRGVLLAFDVREDHEFYMLFVAFGYLTILVEEAPENWRALFDEFERKLDQWSDQNLRTLAAIQQQGQETERMSQSFLRLTDSLKQSNGKTSELQATLKELGRTLNRLSANLSEVRGESKTTLSKTEALSTRFNRTERELKDMASRVDWTWNINWGLTVSVVLLCFLFGWTLWRQQQVIAEQNQRLEWLLLKANREECWNGIKPADDPLCQQLLE
ncbi:MAG: DUF6753 family protein [Cyanobacteria bacterium J06614_10]